MKVRFKIGDVIVISAVLLSSAILFFGMFFFSSDTATTLVVRYGNTQTTYSLLEEDQFEITSGEYALKVVIKDGSAYVKSANCPDNTCVHSGSISRSGQSIVCVPAGLTLTITGEETSYDFIAG